MANTRTASFARGEVAPALRARTDLQSYYQSLATCLNWLVMRAGGAQNRPGTECVAATAGAVTDAVRLVPFVRSDADRYVLEFSDRLMRVYKDGAPVAVGTTASIPYGTEVAAGTAIGDAFYGYVATSDHTYGILYEPPFGGHWRDYWRRLTNHVYEIITPYAAADLAALKVVQSADVMTIVHPDYPVIEITRNGDTFWHLAPVDFRPDVDTPANLAVGSGDPGTRYYVVTAVSEDGEESLPTAATTDANSLPMTGNPVVLSWDPSPGALTYRVYRGETATRLGYVGTGGGMPVPVTDTSWATTTATASTLVMGTWTASAAQARNALTLAAVGDKAYDGQYTVRGQLTVTATSSPSATAEGRVRVYYSRDAEARVDAGVLVTGAQYQAAPGVTLGPIAFEGTVGVPDNGYAALTIDLVPEVLGTGTNGATVTAAVDETVAGDDVVSWRKNGVGYSDDGSVDADMSDTPPVNRAAFGAAGDYPSAVTLYQQRLILAATDAEPERTWASKSARRHNFTVSGVVRDDDAVVWTLVGRRVNEVRHMVDLDDLIQLTSGGVHVVRGNADGVLTPSAIGPRQISSFGAAASGQLAPVVLGDRLLYVQARGSAVRELAPTDGGGYGGEDLTVAASHLVQGYTVADWALQETPDPVLWVVRSDGALLGCTYVREAGVLAWHRHALGGTDAAVENVCCIPEGDEDRLYLVVRRTVNGASVRYVERLGSRTLLPAPGAGSDDDPRVLDAVGFVDAARVVDAWTTLGAGLTLILTAPGGSWAAGQSLTLTATGFAFGFGYVGETFVVEGADGARARLLVTAQPGAAELTVEPESPVAASLQGVSVTRYAQATDAVSTGLTHLEGEAVAVVGDGEVVANPNDPDLATVTVTGGAVSLPRAYAHLRIGLAYESDLETLDIDLPGGSSVKPERRVAPNKVGLQVLRTRALRVGPDEDHLNEVKMRRTSTWAGLPPLETGYYEASIAAGYTSHGRVLVRNRDPLPATVLAIMPAGNL